MAKIKTPPKKANWEMNLMPTCNPDKREAVAIKVMLGGGGGGGGGNKVNTTTKHNNKNNGHQGKKQSVPFAPSYLDTGTLKHQTNTGTVRPLTPK
jgi:hypothetical protein